MPDEVEDEPIDFELFKFIGRKKLVLTNKETMRLTLRKFNHLYQLYKDDFDLELILKARGITYAKLKDQINSESEWF